MSDIALTARPKNRGVTARIVAGAWSSTEMKIAVCIFLALALMTLLAPLVIDASATKITVADRFLPPVFMEGGRFPYLLGTDQLGRDLLLRSLIGLRNALAIGVVSVLLIFVIGCAIGIYSGYRGGWVDVVLMRITDVQMSIPVIILAITILGMSRPTAVTVILVLVLAGWPTYARVARSVTLAERQKEYVRAAKILGASDLRIMALHIAPSILPSIAFVAVLDIARMMIFEAIFGFIGIGIQPPTPTFGTIISAGTQYLLNAWWITIVPGCLLALALTSLNLMGGVLERSRNLVLQGKL
ncbi:ABC transporter permease [Nitratireductor soli]|uniref:ABC transporter permease n=1 Tax=Nitratireductor soli TaxID=1670619 RepID=UPI00065E0451|nr:ABC transporter permease [Nitratireductor soli]